MHIKKTIQLLFLFLLYTTIAIGQTALMSDENYRIMMNDYAVNLNTILTANCPQGMTIDQFKKKIVNGELTLSSTAQTSILSYAEPLKTYGTQFATNKNLIATTDSEKIFLSSFAPSTTIDSSGNLIESTATNGLTAVDMWDCALESFNAEDCSITAIVSDKNDIGLITKSATTFLTQYAGNTGVWIMISGYSDCLNHYYDIEKTGFALSTDNNFVGLINNLTVMQEHQLDETMSDMLLTKGLENLNASEKEEYAISLDFNSLEDLNSFEEVNYNIVANIKNNFYSSGYVKEDHSLIFLSALKYYKKESIVISNNSSFARKAASRGVTGLTSCQKAILWNAAATIGLIACGTGWLCALAIAAKIGSLDAVMDSCAHKPFL